MEKRVVCAVAVAESAAGGYELGQAEAGDVGGAAPRACSCNGAVPRSTGGRRRFERTPVVEAPSPWAPASPGDSGMRRGACSRGAGGPLLSCARCAAAPPPSPHAGGATFGEGAGASSLSSPAPTVGWALSERTMNPGNDGTGDSSSSSSPSSSRSCASPPGAPADRPPEPGGGGLRTGTPRGVSVRGEGLAPTESPHAAERRGARRGGVPATRERGARENSSELAAGSTRGEACALGATPASAAGASWDLLPRDEERLALSSSSDTDTPRAGSKRVCSAA